MLKLCNEINTKGEIDHFQCTIFFIDASTPHLPYPKYYERDYTPKLSVSKHENGKPNLFTLEDNGHHLFTKTSDRLKFEETQTNNLISALARYNFYTVTTSFRNYLICRLTDISKLILLYFKKTYRSVSINVPVALSWLELREKIRLFLRLNPRFTKIINL